MPDGSHYAIQDTALAETVRRALLRRAVDRLDRAERHDRWSRPEGMWRG